MLSTHLPVKSCGNWWMWESKCSSAIAKMAIYSALQLHLHWVMIFHMTLLVRALLTFYVQSYQSYQS